MGHQIIKQDNGLYALWSSIIDDFVMEDATPEDIIEMEIEDAKDRITQETYRIIDDLNSGKGIRGKTYAEACEWRDFVHKNDKQKEEN